MKEKLIEALERLARLESLLQEQAAAQRDIMNTKEAADYIRCTPGSLRKMAERRLITHYKDGGGRTLRFKRAELDRWMQTVRVPSDQDLASEAVGRSIRNNH